MNSRNSIGDLAIVSDSTLTYDEHVTQVVSKCTASLCQINRVKHILDKKFLIKKVNALVFSRLYYCSSVWGNTSEKNIAKLQNVQNFAAPIEVRSYNASSRTVRLVASASDVKIKRCCCDL